MKFAFLILNYNTFDETVNCIKSIEQTFEAGGNIIHVVVVDNHSPDDSVIRLKELYKEKEYIVLEMEDNLGFSKANNIGYKFIRNNYADIDFLIVCNSDVEFKQADFWEKVSKIYNNTEFDILGPDVYAPSMSRKRYKGHQSPAYPWEYTKWYTKYNIMLHSLYIKETKLKRLKKILCKMIFLSEVMVIKTFYRSWRKIPHNNVSLHGSCMIFSKKFIDETDILFYPETKFYFEELILYTNMKKREKTSVYSPQIQVIHWQGRATDIRAKKEGNSEWRCRNLVESGRIYLAMLKNSNNRQ